MTQGSRQKAGERSASGLGARHRRDPRDERQLRRPADSRRDRAVGDEGARDRQHPLRVADLCIFDSLIWLVRRSPASSSTASARAGASRLAVLVWSVIAALHGLRLHVPDALFAPSRRARRGRGAVVPVRGAGDPARAARGTAAARVRHSLHRQLDRLDRRGEARGRSRGGLRLPRGVRARRRVIGTRLAPVLAGSPRADSGSIEGAGITAVVSGSTPKTHWFRRPEECPRCSARSLRSSARRQR